MQDIVTGAKKKKKKKAYSKTYDYSELSLKLFQFFSENWLTLFNIIFKIRSKFSNNYLSIILCRFSQFFSSKKSFPQIFRRMLLQMFLLAQQPVKIKKKFPLIANGNCTINARGLLSHLPSAANSKAEQWLVLG